jgi:hypothetical protein
MTSIDHFTFDKCYQVTDSSFDDYKHELFEIHRIETADECENLAINAQTQFFFVSDFCNNTLKSNCYIPKVIVKDFFTDTLENIFQPFNNILNKIFGNVKLEVSPDTCNNLVIPPSGTGCLYHSPSDNHYAETSIAALYNSQTLSLNRDIFDALEKIKTYKYYEDQLPELSNYDDIIKEPRYEISGSPILMGTIYYNDGGTIASTFKNYICDPTNTTESDFKESISKLNEKYNKMFSFLHEITDDLSNISLLTKNDNQIIMGMDRTIASKRYELEQLLASGGGNNGRLADTNYLKNLKFIEIVIVSLVLLITIFIYIKKK